MHMDNTVEAAAGPPTRVLIVGTGSTIPAVERRLAEIGRTIDVVGRLDLDADPGSRGATLDTRIEGLVGATSPDLAVVSMPAVASDLLADVRTAFRRLGVPERFFPTAADLFEGVGPRTLPDIDPASLLDRAPRPVDHDRIGLLFRGRRVVVTGAGGSIGSELSRRIADYEPAELVLMDRSEHALFEIDRQIARSHPELPRRASLQDVADAAGTLRVFESVRPNIVLHAAAHKHVPLSEDHPREAVRNNLLGSINAVQAAIARQLTERTERAMAEYAERRLKQPRSASEAVGEGHEHRLLVVAGGVAANRTIRARLEEAAGRHGFRFTAPPLAFCTDNAAMIAQAGAERLARGERSDIDAVARPRWPLDEAAALAAPSTGHGRKGAKA